ncbi:hypothetical protein LeptoLang_01485 [Leptospira interrogans serovar Icterohaemorrhagiae]|nr:hypothetical protein LeptoLang_01485 [Leptospira interrogans serovar Icterohaemorrhagiae]
MRLELLESSQIAKCDKSVGTTAFDSKFLKNDHVKFFEILGQVLNIITDVRCCESGICRFILLVLYYKILEFSA